MARARPIALCGETTCTGCMACRNVCPVDAIGQITDRRGFVMPRLDPAVCTGCGKCEQVCPVMNAPDRTEARWPLGAYALYHRSEAVVQMSSSGGAFYALASRTLERGGVVFGCVYDVRHKTARLTSTDETPLETLLTSKYVESYIGLGLRQVRQALDRGREVLFCGAPCQAAGLERFLGGSRENLLIVDFTCGAVTAQATLRDHLSRLEGRYRSPVTAVSFRDKHYGWGQYCFQAAFENGRLYRKTAMSDPYFFCFLRSSMQRLSCHGCPFADRHRSDIVLADLWRYRYFDVDPNGLRGLSLVLTMTEKGQRALMAVGGNVHMQALDTDQAAYNLRERVCPPEKLPEIYADQTCAYTQGVAVLRRHLLGPGRRIRFALRQFVMDHPKLARAFPRLVGDGQIVK